MTKEELEGKGRGELFSLARNAGLAPAKSDSNAELIAKLAGPASRKKQVDRPMMPEGQLMTLDGQRIDGKKYRVTIFSTETDKGTVLLAANGFALPVERNKETIMDEAFVEILRHSTITTTEQDGDLLWRPVTKLTYPHQAIPV